MAAPVRGGELRGIGEDAGRPQAAAANHPVVQEVDQVVRDRLANDQARMYLATEVMENIYDKRLVFQVTRGHLGEAARMEEQRTLTVNLGERSYIVDDPNVVDAIRRGAFHEARAEAQAQGLDVFNVFQDRQREPLVQQVGRAARRALDEYIRPGLFGVPAPHRRPPEQ